MQLLSRSSATILDHHAMLCIMDRQQTTRQVLAIATKVYRTHRLIVKAVPKGPTQRRYVELLRPRYSTTEDQDPGNKPDITEKMKLQQPATTTVTEQLLPRERQRNPCLPGGDEYSRDNFQKI